MSNFVILDSQQDLVVDKDEKLYVELKSIYLLRFYLERIKMKKLIYGA
jgi:hypothetical protein